MKTLLVVAFVAILALATTASAQVVTVPVGVEVGDFTEYGYEKPYSAARVGVEVEGSHLLFKIDSWFSPTQKVGTEDGYSYGGDLRLFGKVGPMIGGVGVHNATAKNSSWQKTATSPVAMLGIERRWGRLWVEKEFEGNDPNEMNGWNVQAQLRLSPNFRFSPKYFQSDGISSDGSRRPFEASGVSLVVEWTPRIK